MMCTTKILIFVHLSGSLASVAGRDIRGISDMLEFGATVTESRLRQDDDISDIVDDSREGVHGIIEDGTEEILENDGGPLSDDLIEHISRSTLGGDNVSDIVDDVVDNLMDNDIVGEILDSDVTGGALDDGLEYNMGDHIENVKDDDLADVVDDVVADDGFEYNMGDHVENIRDDDLADVVDDVVADDGFEYNIGDHIENVKDDHGFEYNINDHIENIRDDDVVDVVDAVKNHNSNDNTLNSDQTESELLDNIERELQDFGNNLGLSVSFQNHGINNIGQTVRDLTIYSRLLNFYALQRYRYYNNLYTMFDRWFPQRFLTG